VTRPKLVREIVAQLDPNDVGCTFADMRSNLERSALGERNLLGERCAVGRMRDIREIVGVIPSDLWGVAKNLFGEKEVSGSDLMNGRSDRLIGDNTLSESERQKWIARTEGTKRP
jgi:hypothetical protein